LFREHDHLGNTKYASMKKLSNMLTVTLLALATGAQLTGPNDTALEMDRVRIQLLNGSSIRGSISRIDSDGTVVGSNLPSGLTIDQIVSAQTELEVTRSAETQLALHLVGGGILLARNPVIADETVTFVSSSGLNKVKLELVQSLIWTDSPKVREVLASPSPDNDRVIVQTENGIRVVEGLLESVNDTHVTLNYQGESRKIPLTIVSAIVSADLGLSLPTGSLATVQLTDGSTIRGRIDQLAGTVMKIELPGRNTIELPSDRIAGFNIQSDNLVYLSDLEPVSVQQRAPFVAQRQWQRDRSILGQPMKLNFVSKSQAVDYEKGIGTQSFSQLVFDNDKDFTRFRAIVGIDAETNGHGDCQMTVLGDGIRLWSQRITAMDDPVPVSVDITGIKRVALMVEPGEQFDLGDHANWAMARFTKSN
jgi:small nuclear ribonucleoprotein (snRNP)-like protein